MPGHSKTTTLITIRLPNDVIAIIKRRIKDSRWDTIGSYLRDRITYDTTRKHTEGGNPKTQLREIMDEERDNG